MGATKPTVSEVLDWLEGKGVLALVMRPFRSGPDEYQSLINVARAAEALRDEWPFCDEGDVLMSALERLREVDINGSQ